MTQVAGLASNRGRNLMQVADGAPGGAQVEVVLSNHADAPVLKKAADRGIPTEVVERDDEESRESHERRILEALDGYDLDLVCLDGYMRVLTGKFLDSAPLTLNVHPSLLPSFPGTNAHEAVLEAGVRVTGCTVHIVTEEVDAGPIVTQEAVPVYEGDDEKNLKERVRSEAEFRAYPRAVRWVAEGAVEVAEGEVRIETDTDERFPARRLASEDRANELRYGENPHQDAALYADTTEERATVVGADQRNEGTKALSYNNYNDADAALGLVMEFEEPAAAVIKHTNPAGCATADTIEEAYDRALSTDPMSAFGGIVALNRACDESTAKAITDSFKEVVVAPDYTEEALSVLREKENLRVLDTGPFGEREPALREKQIAGGRLVQERDDQRLARGDLAVVTERQPTEEEFDSLLFAWHTIKHVKSNAILFANDTETVGVGMGQVSRGDAVRLAAMKAEEHPEGKDAEGAVMASDAFFPFPDGIEEASEAGIEAVIQPGGSVNDEDVIAAANDHDMAMVFTGSRAFRHD